MSGKIGLAGVLVAVLALMLFLRPGDGDPADEPADAGASPAGVVPSATPDAAPSEEAFCEGYRRLAAAQGQYAAVPDATGAEILRGAADDLLATGVPDSMPVLARGGWFIEISGIYGSLGEELAPEAVPGAADGDQQVAGASGAFASWLADLCPAW